MIPLTKLNELRNKNPKAVAIIEGNGSITYDEMFQMTKNCVDALVNKHNAHKLNRAVFIAGNRYEMLVLMSAFSTLKVPFIGLDYTSSVERKTECIKSISADCIVYTKEFSSEVELIKKCLDIKSICVDEEFENLAAECIEVRKIDISNIERPFESISFTSGTSGAPKVVFRNKPFDARRFPYLSERFNFTSSDIFIVTVPFYHVSAMGWARLFLNLGAAVVLGDIKNPLNMAAEIIKHNVTTMLIVPNILDIVTKAYEDKLVEENPDLKFIIVGGKHFPSNLKRRSIEIFGAIVHEYYGSTETGINVIADPKDLIDVPDSSGKAMDGSDVLIIGANAKPLPAGEKGRVAISSYQNMAGYLNATVNKVEINGLEYIITPDYGWLDKNGYLFLTSRTNPDVNIYKLENALSQIAGINDSYIFIGDKGAVVCVITVDNGLDGSEVMAKVQEVLKSNGVNEYKIVNSEIPYSLSGKVNLERLKSIIDLNDK